MSMVDQETMAKISSLPGRMVAYTGTGYSVKDEYCGQLVEHLREMYKESPNISAIVMPWLQNLMDVVRPTLDFKPKEVEPSPIELIIESLTRKAVDSYGRQGNLIVALSLKVQTNELPTLQAAVNHSIRSFNEDLRAVKAAAQEYEWLKTAKP